MLIKYSILKAIKYKYMNIKELWRSFPCFIYKANAAGFQAHLHLHLFQQTRAEGDENGDI